MNILNLFGEEISQEELQIQNLSKKELKRIERAKLKKLGEANYFYPTTGKNIFYSDGFLNGQNGETHKGGFTIFKNKKWFTTIFHSKETTIMTNNEAELAGAAAALSVASVGDEVIVDSMNTLAWIRSGNPKARPDLKWLAEEARNNLKVKKVNLYWRPREENLAGIYNENKFNA